MTEASPKVNILITGTPGTGKTTLSEMVASSLLLRHVNVGQLIKDKKLHDGYIPEFDSYELNEDKVCVLGLPKNQLDHQFGHFPERQLDASVEKSWPQKLFLLPFLKGLR